MSAPQNQPDTTLASLAQIDQEESRLKEQIRQRKLERERLEEEQRANEAELARLDEECRRHSEELQQHQARLVGLNRERDVLNEHIRLIESRQYKKKSKELWGKPVRAYLEAIRFALNRRRLPISIVQTKDSSDFVAENCIPIEAELASVESRLLQIKAKGLGIEIETNPVWWNDHKFEELSSIGRTRVAKSIREE